MHRLNLILAAAALVAAGCSSSEPQITSQDANNFSGKPGAPMTDSQKKAMANFQEEFKKKHPSNGPQGPVAPSSG